MLVCLPGLAASVLSVEVHTLRPLVQRLLSLSVLCLLFWLPGSASATPVFTCGATTAVCNGLTYAVTYDGQFGLQQQYSLWIRTSSAYTGNTTDLIKGVALSEMAGLGAGSHATLVAAPGGVANWDFSLKELNANGCGGGGTNSLCAEFDVTGAYGYALAFTPATVYTWSFRYNNTGVADPQAHIKYEFVRGVAVGNGKGSNAIGAKVGSLGSWDIGIQTNFNVQFVPDAGSTVTLLGLGLLAVGVLRRFI